MDTIPNPNPLGLFIIRDTDLNALSLFTSQALPTGTNQFQFNISMILNSPDEPFKFQSSVLMNERFLETYFNNAFIAKQGDLLTMETKSGEIDDVLDFLGKMQMMMGSRICLESFQFKEDETTQSLLEDDTADNEKKQKLDEYKTHFMNKQSEQASLDAKELQ